jgi:diguanylate cyclase (GGDEF)-like protein
MVQVSRAYDAPLLWREELLSLAFYVLAAGVLLLEHGTLGNRLAAIVRLFERAEEGDFSEVYEDEKDSRPDAVTQVGRAYNRVRRQLSSLVLTDALTNCVNRRGFDQALTREVARASRAGSEMSLLALDLDHFKSVNDTLGHLAGDAVLAEMGSLLLRSAREGDIVSRTGGEEFSIILPDTARTGAFQLASRICEIVRQQAFSGGTNGVRLTVSIGVVSAAPTLHSPTREIAETLKGRSDEALYAAKRGGRDRVRAWSPLSEPAPAGT